MTAEAPEVVLVLAADAPDQVRLRLDLEVRQIENALMRSRKRFEVKYQRAARHADLRRALIEHRPSYVHFCGHGAGHEGIVLEGQLVDAEALAELFGLFSERIECVVLNACYSTVQAQAIAKHIDFVVGMGREIGDAAAIEFASAFYDGIGDERSVEFSFRLGRNAIALARIPEHLTPKLLSRADLLSSPPLVQLEMPPRSPRQDWDGAPDVSVLFGRELMAEKLRTWILDDSCRVVLITGLGGIGKSDLASCLGRGGNRSPTSATLANGIHGQFDCVMWRGLVNAPPPGELFADMLDFLSEHRHDPAQSHSKQLEGILRYLQDRRCFIILDNVEAVLEPGDPTMGYRDGYEEYGVFFELVAKTSHQSCLLLTSREKPRPIADLAGEQRPVRSLTLTGIGERESQEVMFRVGRFAGSEVDWQKLVQLYNGNPLALRLAAHHIQDVHGSDLATFLGSGRPVFATLEELLDGHLDRLTPEETEVVYWFAIEREPLTLAALQHDLVSPAAQTRLASTLQGLQRRLPVEQMVGGRFTLQPVLIEHVTARLVSMVSSALTRLLSATAHAHDATSPEQERSAKPRPTPQEQRELFEALLDAFPSVGDLRELVSLELGDNLQWIAASGNLRSVVLDLMEHMESRGRTDDLVQAALAMRPGDPRLRAIAQRRSLPLRPRRAGLAGDDDGSAALRILNTHALLKATAKEDVRSSQRRLILGPIAERLSIRDREEVAAMCRALLDAWRHDGSREPGYLAGNVVNLLSHLRMDLRAVPFGHMPVWQACMHDVSAHEVDFSFAAFRDVTFKHPFGTVFSLCYSPDGRLIAVGDDNGDIRLFVAASGQLCLRCSGHTDVVGALTFSPDGQVIASASFDSTIRIWSVTDGRCLDVLLGHEGWVYSLAWSPDGRSLASASEDGTARLWDLRAARSVKLPTADAGFLAAVVFSPDGKLLAVGGSSCAVSLFRLDDFEHPSLLSGHSGRVRALAFSPQGDMLASGAEDQEVRIWRPTDGALLATLAGHSGGITSLSFSALGDVLASASVDQTVRLWATPRKECAELFQVASARVWAVGCSPAGRTFATASEDSAVRVWDMDTRQCLTTLRGYSNKTWSLASVPGSSLIVAGNEDGVVRVWDPRETRVALELRGHTSRIWSVAASPDGRWVASGSDDLTVRIWDLRSGGCAHVLRGHRDWIRSVAFDAESRLVASAAEDGRVFVWDVAGGRCRTTIDTGMSRVFAVTFCHENGLIAAGGDARPIYLFSPDGTRVGELAGHQGWLSHFSVRGRDLASCSEDGTVRIWDTTRMECTAVFAIGAKVWCGAFQGDEDLFLSGSDDGVLRALTLSSGRCAAQVRAHQGALCSLTVSRDENVVATVGDDGGIRLWDLPDLMPCPSSTVLRPARPYEGMNITGATGLTPAQRDALMAFGAISLPGP